VSKNGLLISVSSASQSNACFKRFFFPVERFVSFSNISLFASVVVVRFNFCRFLHFHPFIIFASIISMPHIQTLPLCCLLFVLDSLGLSAQVKSSA
jgi:hypothetical protein